MLACPNGIEYSSTGTMPRVPSSFTVSMNNTGSSSKIAVVRRPLASAGELGMTTFRPGMPMNQPSSDCECVAPVPIPLSTATRTVIGEVVRPPVMYRIFAAWLAI